MALIPLLNTFVPATTINPAPVNDNFVQIRSAFNATAVLTDVAKTIEVTHAFNAKQEFGAGIDVTGAVAVTGALTATTLAGGGGGLTGLNASQITTGTIPSVDRLPTIPWSKLSSLPAFATRWPTYAEVTSKPSTFPPDAHTHGNADITGLAWAKLTGVPDFASRWPTYAEVTSKPSTFAPSAHNHAAGDINSGTLAVARGGTGVGTLASGNLLVGAGTGAMTALAPSTAGGYVRSNGSAWVRSTIPAGDIPNLSANKITTDTLAEARIPSLAASKITSGEFNIARIPTITVAKVVDAIAKVTISTADPTGSPAVGTFWAKY